MTHLHDRRAAFIAALLTKDHSDRGEAIANEVIETGGEWLRPGRVVVQGTALHEIHLHGISAYGVDDIDVCANWTTAAMIFAPGPDIEDDGFITLHPPLTRPMTERTHHDPSC